MNLETFPDEALVQRMPLPLAQLYRRAHNAKTPLERHLAAYYLWEAGLKLLSAVAVVEYAAGPQHDPQLTERLTSLARPSLGHWWEFVRQLTPVLAERGHEGMARIRELVLLKSRDDLPRAAGLDAALREALGSGGGPRTSVWLADLFDRLVTYRNRVIGHGAPVQHKDDLHQRMAGAMLAGVAEVLGRLDVLAGRRLIHLGEMRQSGGIWLVPRYELIGEAPRRLATLEVPHEQLSRLPQGDRLYLGDVEATDPLSSLVALHPLVLFDAEETRVLFLNSRKGQRKTQYLCYSTGAVSERPDLGNAQRTLLASVLGLAVSEAEASAWAERSHAEEPADEADALQSPRRLGDYELLSELGRGGMGIVYRAWQGSLGRQVALKSMLHLGDPKADARFRREIRALGKVDHPHLVKVYASGSEGEHWFCAMELIEGVPLGSVSAHLVSKAGVTVADLPSWRLALDTVCDTARRSEKPLSSPAAPLAGRGVVKEEPAFPTPPGSPPQEVRGGKAAALPKADRSYVLHIVELVRQAATAAHALHEAGIIHRDIKPDNIMVTVQGSQAVLMDLGLVQLADDVEGRLTRSRQFVGTLRYASPEQVLAVARLDRTSDIYSLGATLWELVTLQPLYGETAGVSDAELMQKIQIEEPPPARACNAAVSADLSAVIEKCLQKNPKQRYATAAELAQELSHVLAGEPVQARAVRAPERLWRWCRRRPAVAGLIGMTVLCLVGVAVGASLFAWQAEERRQDAEIQTQAARTAEETAKANARLANEQRDLALKTMRLVREDIQEELRNKPGLDALRKKLLMKVLDGLKEVARSTDNAGLIDMVTVQAHVDLGDWHAAFGTIASAKTEYEIAHGMCQQFVQSKPSVQTERELALIQERMGDVNRKMGQLLAARDWYAKSLDIRERAAASSPTPRQQSDLATILNHLSDAWRELGDYNAAREYCERGLRLRQALADADRENRTLQRDLAISFDRLAGLAKGVGQLTAAKEWYEKSATIWQALAADPLDAAAQSDLALSWNNRGLISRGLSDLTKAREHYDQALKIRLALAAGDPNNVAVQIALIQTLQCLGDLVLQQGHPAEAQASFEKALKINANLAAADPQNLAVQRDRSILFERLGDVYNDLNEDSAAKDAYEKSLSICLKLAAADTNNVVFRRSVAWAYDKLGLLRLNQGDGLAAKEFFEQSWKIRDELAKTANDGQTRSELATSLDNLAAASLSLGQTAPAKAWSERSLKLRQDLAAADPANADSQRNLAHSFERLGDALRNEEQWAPAKEQYEKGLKIRMALAEREKTNSEAQRDLTLSLDIMGDICRDMWQLTAARGFFEKSLLIRQTLASADPANAKRQRDVSISYDKLGWVCEMLGQWEDAKQWYLKRLQIAEKQAAATPEQLANHTDVIFGRGNLADVALQTADFATAKSSYTKVVDHVQRLAKAGRLQHTEFESWPKFYRESLERAVQTEKWVLDPGKIKEQPVDRQREVLPILVCHCVKLGKIKEALSAAALLGELEPERGQTLFGAACAYGRILDALAATDNQRDTVAQLALTLLKQAAAKDFRALDMFQDHADLQALQQRPEMRALVKELQALSEVPTPAGWAKNTIALPPVFAPDMKWKGAVELRLPPGMFNADAADFFSYALLFWLPDDAEIDVKTMERELLAYYRGLAAKVLKDKKQEVNAQAFTLTIAGAQQQPDKRSGGEPVAGYVGEMMWTEPYTTGKPQTIRLEIHAWSSAQHKRNYVFICASPQPETAALWKTLREIRAGCTFR